MTGVLGVAAGLTVGVEQLGEENKASEGFQVFSFSFETQQVNSALEPRPTRDHLRVCSGGRGWL